ncbi:MAG: phosphoglycerate kinase [Bdellovibrionota bacterium]
MAVERVSHGLRGIKTVRDFEFKDKVVFLRLDLNVPLKNGKITDETRIVASLPTIKFIQEAGGKIVMASHLGRPKSADDKEFSMEPIAHRLSELLNAEVILAEEPDGEGVKQLLGGLKPHQMILLENVRYIPGETIDSEEFAHLLASYTDIYINDAFGASHRAHSTIHALPNIVKQKGMGLLIEKEVRMLDSLLENTEKPYWAILGGAKVSDKIPVFEKLIDLVDGFIVGGAMAYTFLKAMGLPVGKSLVEEDKVKYAREMIARVEARGKSFLLPVDHVVVKNFSTLEGLRTTKDRAMADDEIAVDIGPETQKQFAAALKNVKTIFWNGPMGVFENPKLAAGTFSVAQALADNKGTKIVGGGDSAAAAELSGLADKMTHISTGGGASLEYLQGEKLPGLEILRDKRALRAKEV